MVVFKCEIPMLFRGTCATVRITLSGLRKVSCSSDVNDMGDMRTIICSHYFVDDNIDDNNVISM